MLIVGIVKHLLKGRLEVKIDKVVDSTNPEFT